MSESGKIPLSSMTPERIEEIKLKKGDRVVMHTCIEAETHNGRIWTCKSDQFTRGTGVYEQDSVFLEGYGGSFAPEYLQKIILPTEDERVLAALEESQQQIKELQEGNRSACESRDMAYRSRDEAIVTSNQHYKQAFFLSEGLIEAQQNIARQQESERSIIYEVSEIRKEAAAGNNGSLDRADTALKRIMLLSSNLLALGNKEGSDKA